MTESIEVFIGVAIGLGITSVWVAAFFLLTFKIHYEWPRLALVTRAAVLAGIFVGFALVFAGLGTMALMAGGVS